ncbi:MAG TPA: M56 family metallopeptidase, partial [Catenuloplanes sp.]
MSHAAHFAAALLGCYLTARVLAGAGWLRRAPRTAIVCWQGVGLAVGLSAIGLPLALGLAPYRDGTGVALLRLLGDLAGDRVGPGLGPVRIAAVGAGLAVAAALCGTTLTCVLRTARAQRRHRDLLTLVARRDPAAPGALVLDHPRAAAYCLPGRRPCVVVSAGTLRLLDARMLAAVLCHERAHAVERHDLVLLPFTALRRVAPWARWVRTAADTVALLVEMRADDAARRRHADTALAAALVRFAACGAPVAPTGTLGIADAGIAARVARLV